MRTTNSKTNTYLGLTTHGWFQNIMADSPHKLAHLASASLRQHGGHVHSTQTYECQQCKYVTRREANLQRHTKVVHAEVKNFSGNQCAFSTSLNNALKQHIKNVHESTRNSPGDRCSYAGKHKGALQVHAKAKHDKIKDFACPNCEHKSFQKAHLKSHIRKMHPNQPDTIFIGLFLLLIDLKAAPKNIEKTIICNIFPSAIALTGLVGNILIITSFN